MQHLIESSSLVMIIHTDHEVNVNIIKQISLLMMSTEKQNLHLVYASKYFQHFNLNIHHKSKKQHIVSDALSQLALTMLSETDKEKNKLDTLYVNVLFVETYIKMSDKFQKCFIEDYNKNSA